MTAYFIWLSVALGAGNSRSARILSAFPNPEELYCLNKEERRQLGLFTEKELQRLDVFTLQDAIKMSDRCDKMGVEIIPFGDERYPYCLSVIDTPPFALYVKGTLPNFDENPAICVVGSRKSTEYGKKSAYSLGYRLARAGVIVVSGGATGCDAYAHIGALKARGIAVMLMPCGFGAAWLPQNEPLRKRVAKSGCLITEYPPQTPVSKITYPIRNRLMAALTLGTVVVEAGEKSGTVNTAMHAAEQGKDVFVLPGLVGKPEYAGSNALLRDGAKLFLDMSDIFDEYVPRFPDKMDIKRAYEPIKEEKSPLLAPVHKKLSNETLSKQAQIVYNHIRKPKFYPEEIVVKGLTKEEILSALSELEVELLIKACPGGLYALIK